LLYLAVILPPADVIVQVLQQCCVL